MIIPTSNQLASRLFSLLSAPFIVFFEIIDLESEVFPGAETEVGFLPLKKRKHILITIQNYGLLFGLFLAIFGVLV